MSCGTQNPNLELLKRNQFKLKGAMFKTQLTRKFRAFGFGFRLFRISDWVRISFGCSRCLSGLHRTSPRPTAYIGLLSSRRQQGTTFQIAWGQGLDDVMRCSSPARALRPDRRELSATQHQELQLLMTSLGSEANDVVDSPDMLMQMDTSQDVRDFDEQVGDD